MTSDPPALSIGMPVFNGERFVEEALNSLLSQTFENYELIISDNGSTDGTGKICQDYARKDKRIRYYRHNINKGPIFNFNFVRQHACGEFFMWAAHDDLWDREWVDRLIGNFRNNTAISFGTVVNIDENGEIVRAYRDLKFSGKTLIRLLAYFMADEHSGKANLIYGIYRNNLIRCVNFKQHSISSFGDDMLFVYQILEKGNVYTDQSVNIYKRVPVDYVRHLTFKQILSRLFLTDWVKYIVAYPTISTKSVDTILLAFLFPAKYISAIVFNLFYIFKRVASRLKYFKKLTPK